LRPVAHAVGSYSETKRADAARVDLPPLIGSELPVGLVLLDDDDQEQAVILGQVIRVGPDFVVFRRHGLDEEIPLGLISKRVVGETIVPYGDHRRR
jgi:hypothetical protein